MKYTFMTLAACAAAFLSGETRGLAQNAGADQTRTPQVQRTSTDDDVEQLVRKRLETIDGLESSRLRVEAENGIVTVTGTIGSLVERERILEAVSATRGVENVITSVSVESQRRSDEALRQDVRDALAFDPAVSRSDAQVAVSNGIVTLTGQARSWAEKRLIGWLAGEVRGVREVRNEMAVNTAPRPDAEIKAAIEQRFASDPMVRDTIAVSVREGRVVLKGEVRSALEKRWAIFDAQMSGVREVDASALHVNPEAAVPRGYARRLSDEEIRAAIESAYRTDPRVFSFNPKVQVQDGVVMLSGEVSNLKARQAAVQLAKGTAGVKEVRDNLRVRTAARPDEQVAVDVRRAFARSLLADANQIHVRVADGRAFLTGQVDSNFEKWGAGDIAARIEGVIEVENRLEVDSATQGVIASEFYHYPWHSSQAPATYSTVRDPRGDFQLLTDIRSHLRWSPFTDIPEITVAVEDGVVTLRGHVESPLERQVAEDYAYQAGARRVDNRLTILEPTGR